MNALWEKYGCTKCDNYPLLVLTANFSNNKSSFQTNFIDKYGVETPCVPREDGGTTFNTALNNQNYGGPTYLIYPDRTFVGRVGDGATEQDIIAAGIEPHECGTHITNNFNQNSISNNITFHKVTENCFSVDVLKEGVYSISFYSANGQLKEALSETFLSTGSHNVTWKNGKLANGIYLVEMKNGKNITRQKVILE